VNIKYAPPWDHPSVGRQSLQYRHTAPCRIRTPYAATMLVACEYVLAKLSQSLLKPTFLGQYLACQD
jgi:hypothetical protein